VAKLGRRLGLLSKNAKAIERSIQEVILALTGVDMTICPWCGTARIYLVADTLRYSGLCATEIIRPPTSCKAAA
jgi:hypothetical protein